MPSKTDVKRILDQEFSNIAKDEILDLGEITRREKWSQRERNFATAYIREHRNAYYKMQSKIDKIIDEVKKIDSGIYGTGEKVDAYKDRVIQELGKIVGEDFVKNWYNLTETEKWERLREIMEIERCYFFIPSPDNRDHWIKPNFPQKYEKESTDWFKIWGMTKNTFNRNIEIFIKEEPRTMTPIQRIVEIGKYRSMQRDMKVWDNLCDKKIDNLTLAGILGDGNSSERVDEKMIDGE